MQSLVFIHPKAANEISELTNQMNNRQPYVYTHKGGGCWIGLFVCKLHVYLCMLIDIGFMLFQRKKSITLLEECLFTRCYLLFWIVSFFFGGLYGTFSILSIVIGLWFFPRLGFAMSFFHMESLPCHVPCRCHIICPIVA
jgi:hypothetical protein